MVKEDSCTYTIYALECEPNWELPSFREPMVLFSDQLYPIEELHPEIIQHPNYYSNVIDGSVNGEDKGIPVWRFLAHSAKRVLYVGQTEDFENRVFEHRDGGGSKLTAESIVKCVIERVEYSQNLRLSVIESLEEEITQIRGSLLLFDSDSDYYTEVSKRLKHVQGLLSFVMSLDGLTLSKSRSIQKKHRIDRMGSVIDEKQAEREKMEKQWAEYLTEAPVHQIHKTVHP
ncbi:GIY-YIG nuclease family protein [Halogeometricum sp. CBA1124]|uniref:GIY-YIG nuclease family protein n=1 Tax=Halogeometricum sp. CBA1124 TaxID=2668071 RepID=UPI0014295E91|nr:GIY-YIG nuclease family protein [Halogeometricum sp. CBA1124]MUV56255.1 hypothetical protein [Halogeometricum sp. CBA1124]